MFPLEAAPLLRKASPIGRQLDGLASCAERQRRPSSNFLKLSEEKDVYHRVLHGTHSAVGHLLLAKELCHQLQESRVHGLRPQLIDNHDWNTRPTFSSSGSKGRNFLGTPTEQTNNFLAFCQHLRVAESGRREFEVNSFNVGKAALMLLRSRDSNEAAARLLYANYAYPIIWRGATMGSQVCNVVNTRRHCAHSRLAGMRARFVCIDD